MGLRRAVVALDVEAGQRPGPLEGRSAGDLLSLGAFVGRGLLVPAAGGQHQAGGEEGGRGGQRAVYAEEAHDSSDRWFGGCGIKCPWWLGTGGEGAPGQSRLKHTSYRGQDPPAQPSLAPPSTYRVWPVMYDASSLHRKAAAAAMSSGKPTRRTGLD